MRRKDISAITSFFLKKLESAAFYIKFTFFSNINKTQFLNKCFEERIFLKVRLFETQKKFLLGLPLASFWNWVLMLIPSCKKMHANHSYLIWLIVHQFSLWWKGFGRYGNELISSSSVVGSRNSRWSHSQLLIFFSRSALGHDFCSPSQDGLFITCCVTIGVLVLMLTPHVADHSLQGFHEHVTYLHWPNNTKRSQDRCSYWRCKKNAR